MRIKPIYDKLERQMVAAGRVLDWYDFRDAIDTASGCAFGPKTLDRHTQGLVNRFHKNNPHLLKRE